MYTLGDKQFKLLNAKRIDEHLTEIESILGKETLDFIHAEYHSCRYKMISYVLRHSLTYDELIDQATSKVSGKLMKFNGYKFLMSDDDANWMRGSGHRGVKRPEHSKKLKGRPNPKNSKSNWSKSRIAHSIFMNSVEWKRTVLENKGINIVNMNDDQIEDMYSEFRREVQASNSYKISKVQSFLENQKYDFHYDRDAIIDLLDRHEYNEAFSIVNSIISTVAILDPSNNMGLSKFQTTSYTDQLPKCLNKDPFTTRSSYESDFIDHVIIPNIDQIEAWSFEENVFRSGNTTYTPDFMVQLDGIKYYIELKGFIRDETHLKKIQSQVHLMFKSGVNYAFINFNPKHLTIQDIKLFTQMQLFKKTHQVEYSEPQSGISIGLSRDQIISNLDPNSLFIMNGLFMYTVSEDWKNIMFYLIINDKCIAELQYDVINKKVVHSTSTSNRFAGHLKDNYELHLSQLKQLKTKSDNAQN